MESSNGRGGLLSAGGVLSIIVGVFELIGGAGMAVLFATGWWRKLESPFLSRFPDFPFRGQFHLEANLTWLIIIGIIVAVLGIIAIAGGRSAITRGSFGLSLGGAICALLPLNLLGLLAVIFVGLGKREFE